MCILQYTIKIHYVFSQQKSYIKPRESFKLPDLQEHIRSHSCVSQASLPWLICCYAQGQNPHTHILCIKKLLLET